ncbi:MAG: efflux RND transporter periplasmic adaptor subunit [Desulfobulbaceae bacterium]|nr:efflux RND transporter periplasmic adaptor subunit [Desulfobulbaceae bacterium]
MCQNKKNKVIVWLFAVGLACILSSCNQEPGSVVNKEFTLHYLPVTEVVDEELPVYYTTIGSVISDNRIQITSRITGYINKISVREGQQIHKGDLLVSLDSSDIDGAIQQAEAAVNKSRSALKDAQIDFERYEALFKEGSVPENAFRKIRLQRDVSRETLHAALAAYETAKSQHQYILIKSPVDGVVVERQKRAGDLATPGFPIISIESEKALLFKSFVPESQIQKLIQGDEVTVFIDAPGTTLNGQISRLIPSGDPVTRSYEIKISLNDTTGLLPGMFGRVRFQVGTETSPVIARTAVVERGGLRGVFVVDAEQRAYFRWLRFGREWPDRLQVQAGVSQGERIVAHSVSLIHDGDLIRTGDRDE